MQNRLRTSIGLVATAAVALVALSGPAAAATDTRHSVRKVTATKTTLAYPDPDWRTVAYPNPEWRSVAYPDPDWRSIAPLPSP
jgi:hypothetical protein